MSLVSAYNGDKPFAFISYSHKDTDIVLQIVSQMQADGFRVWYDEGIKPGTDWDEFIASRINKSSYFIAFLSENYLNSTNCKDEMNYARDKSDNILLVYIEPVSMPSGMELRFGRSQAIHAYNYEVKAEFFEKFYLSENINICKGNDFGVAEESVVNFSASVPTTPKSASPAPVNKTSAPKTKVQRVPASNPKKKNSNQMGLIAAIAAVVIVLAVVGIVVASNISKKNSIPQGSSSAEITKTTDKDLDPSVVVETVTTSDTEESVKAFYSSYGLSVGEYKYFTADTEFYNNIGTPLFYDSEREEYVLGLFVNTPSMNIMIPVKNDYAEPISVKWYYVEPGGTEKLVSEVKGIYPTPDEGVSWYELYLSEMDMGGDFPGGVYYAVVFAGDEMKEAMVIKVEYQTGD